MIKIWCISVIPELVNPSWRHNTAAFCESKDEEYRDRVVQVPPRHISNLPSEEVDPPTKCTAPLAHLEVYVVVLTVE